MDAAHRELGQKFSAAVIAKDYAAAHALLAPWLQKSMTADQLRADIDQHVREMCEIWNMEQPVYPAECNLDGNSHMNADGLREPDYDGSEPNVPAEVTNDNMRYWMCMQFQPAEGAAEFDAFFDLWAALVEHAGALRIGYYRFMDPD